MAERQQEPEATLCCPADKNSHEAFPTATRYVIITKDNIREEVQPGDHLAYTTSLCGKLQETASNSCIIVL